MKTLNTFLLMILMAASATAAVPRVFNYQGYVEELDGTALDGSYNLVFRIYEVDSGVDPALWTESHPAVIVTDGIFSVLLGSLVDLPPAVLEESELWIGVTVGADTEIAPRLQVTSTPWAYRAAIADSSAVTGAGGGDGGTVINVATGAGLTGGPITTSGTISVANGGITNGMLAIGSVYGSTIANGTITGTDIANDSIFAADIATNAVGADEIAANAVGTSEIQNGSIIDSDIMDEPGIASVADTGTPVLTSSNINVTARTISYPATGYVVATATCYGYTNHSNGTSSHINLSLSQTSQVHHSGNDVQFAQSSAAPSGVYRTPMTTTEVFSVGGSGSLTIYLIANASSGANCSVFSTNLVLMYFPTSYGSVTKAEENDHKDLGK